MAAVNNRWTVTTRSALTFRFASFLRLPTPATPHARTLGASTSDSLYENEKTKNSWTDNNFVKLLERTLFSRLLQSRFWTGIR
jgi:hypothetical protein